MDKILKMNEMFGNESDSYKTEINDVTIYGQKLQDDFGTYDEKCNITWKMEIDALSWGIEDFYPVIEKIELSYILEDFEKETDETIEQVLIKGDWTFEVVFSNDIGGGSTLQITPDSVEIDFDTKNVEINF